MTHATPLIDLSAASVRIYDRTLSTSLKRYLLHREPAHLPQPLTILDGITFRATPGDRIGVIGRNGSGKTSLLKLIAGIYPVASGGRHVIGNIASVIAQGVGFDPELSLRDNIRLGLVHMGLYHQWSRSFEDQVLDFAELTHRATEPLKVLSTGYQARLAFSLTLFQEPDILLLDEVLAAGDYGFVGKAKDAMVSRLVGAAISVFVSHSEGDILGVCNRCLLMAGGQLVADGAPDTVIAEYHRNASGAD